MEQNKPDGLRYRITNRDYCVVGGPTRAIDSKALGAFDIALNSTPPYTQTDGDIGAVPDGMWKHPNTKTANPLVGGPLIDDQKCGYSAIYLMTIPQLWYIGAVPDVLWHWNGALLYPLVGGVTDHKKRCGYSYLSLNNNPWYNPWNFGDTRCVVVY